MTVQFVPVFARSQSLSPVTHPGSLAGIPPTTAFMANAVLFVIFESQGFEILTKNVTLDPLAAVIGITGILTVSSPIGAEILVVFVHVTPVPTCAPQDQPLFVNDDAGPVILVGIVRITVWRPLEDAFPTLVTVIGISERRLVVSGHSGCAIPGMRSGTLAAT